MQQKFLDSDVAAKARESLQRMVDDPSYNTDVSYGTDAPFIERHMRYMSEHPKLDPQHYLSNLRLKTRIK